MPRFRIVVPAYRAEAWVDRCIASIREQTVREFRCVIIDDASPDRTYERAIEAAKGDARFEVTRNAERRLALANVVQGIARVSDDPDDVLVTVDGDDWLARRDALAIVQNAYRRDAWITYGSYRRWEGTLLERLGLRRKHGIARPYPEAVARARAYREHRWIATHLRTFKRFLWDGVRDEDLRDDAGEYWRVSWDLAFMFPMLEMAGPDHTVYVPQSLYVYNRANPINDHAVAAGDQLLTACRIRLKERYAPLDRPPART